MERDQQLRVTFDSREAAVGIAAKRAGISLRRYLRRTAPSLRLTSTFAERRDVTDVATVVAAQRLSTAEEWVGINADLTD